MKFLGKEGATYFKHVSKDARILIELDIIEVNECLKQWCGKLK
jgi:hypothetical protein